MLSKSHANLVYSALPPKRRVRQSCEQRFDSGGFTSPTCHEIRAVMHQYRLTGADVADLLGVSDSRTVRRWTGGRARMSYAAWRLLLYELGMVIRDADENQRSSADGVG